MNRPILLYLFIVLQWACNALPDKEKIIASAKFEIDSTEKAFETMVAEKGLQSAFTYFAAPGAVINRNDSIVAGIASINLFYSKPSANKISLKWSPDFTDVAASGDLGYTYGNYRFSSTDSSGKVVEYRGIFHTVWKKQPDGSWKYVWD